MDPLDVSREHARDSISNSVKNVQLNLKSARKLPSEQPFAAHSGAIENVTQRNVFFGLSGVRHRPLKSVSLAEFRAFEFGLTITARGTMRAGPFASGGLNHQLTSYLCSRRMLLFTYFATCRTSSLRDSKVSSSLFFRSLESLSHITIYSHNKFILRGKNLAPRACGFKKAHGLRISSRTGIPSL